VIVRSLISAGQLAQSLVAPVGARLLARDPLEGARKGGVRAVTHQFGRAFDGDTVVQPARGDLHAQQEQEHADWLAERIVQLNGKPDFNPATLLARSHAEYDDSEDVQSMVRANLIAERVAIESYRQMIVKIGDKDPTTRHLLIKIMAVEEEHADDMRDLME